MNWPTETLGSLLVQAGTERAGSLDLPVLSITMKKGLVDQADKFKKRVASNNISSYRIVYPNELVVGFPIDEGVLGFQTKYPAAVVSPAYGVWSLKKPLETHIPYFEKYLRSVDAKNIYASKMTGAVARRRTIKKEDFLKIEVPFPPLDEQKRIATLLTKADVLRQQRQRSLLLIEELLESIFIDMFGDPVKNSKGLPIDALSNLAKLERGKFTPRPRNDPSYFDGQFPFIQTGDIARSKGRIKTWTQTLNQKGANVSKEFGVGTVVIAIVGATLGETAIVETPVYCPDSIIGITPIPERATSEFLEFLLRLWKGRLKELAPDAARANLNLERLRPLTAIVPTLGEQQKFTDIATRLHELASTMYKSEHQLDQLFSSLQQRAFRGELNLQQFTVGTDDKIADQLVEEVRSADGRIYYRPGSFLPTKEIEDELFAMEERFDLAPGSPRPWSEIYFKYRTLGQALLPPFSFSEIWEAAVLDMEEASYETVKEKIFEYVENDVLEQQFDEKRKEIVFNPRA